MGLEQNNAQHYREVVDKFVNPVGSYELANSDYVIRPSADGDSGPIILTLPRVAEAKGRFYSIVARKADVTNTITIQDRDDSECWPADIVLNAKCDRCLLYSDGLCWITVEDSGDRPDVTTESGTTGVAATTASSTTAAPSTTAAVSTTAAPTTLASTTAAPTTTAPTTLAPTTAI